MVERQNTLVKDDKPLKETAAELTAKTEMALRNRYCKPEWATFFEVHGETNHRADCIAFNMFPSRNFKIIGFEIKSLRNDWLRELQNGHKADYFVGQCDEWYIVESQKGVVKKDELPKGWGLIRLQGSRLFTKVKSDVGFKAEPSREFFVRMIHQSHEQNVSDRVLYEARELGRKEGSNDAMKNDFDRNEMQKKAALVDKMKEMGLEIWAYKIEEVKGIVELKKLLSNLGNWGVHGKLENVERSCDDIKEKIKECRESLEKLEGVRKDE